MVTTFYFIRHAEPDYSIEEDAIRPLSEKGKKDAENLVDFFRDIPFDMVISSPFKRAHDTVKPIAYDKGMEVELIDGFRERKVSGGGWIDDFTSFARRQWEDFEYRLNGGDCLREVQKRNIEALEDLLDRSRGRGIVIGSHGTALSTIINYYDSTYGYNEFNRIKGVMPWVVRFTFNDGNKPLIESLNAKV